MMNPELNPARFGDLGLPDFLLQTVEKLGYESPSPIQAQSIPILLEGTDLLGQAQTGTGKTAAFALPLLARLDTQSRETQALVLTPTRELAIQVAEACQVYARGLPGFHVVPIYGGAGYALQLKQLRNGAQLVVGTPGRIMDHMRKGSLKLGGLQTLVLDEADEMLRMGFIDDVEWILQQTPAQRQIALFSATMPREIQRVAERYLRDPRTVKIAGKTSTAAAIRQRYWPVAGLHKLDALTRILEMEATDGAIIFVRTKVATEELAEKLVARGFAAEALNGDMPQAQREKAIERMRKGLLDLLVATDVAARGIDIPRISHVINYDIPFDTEAYVHRIGRTGRAGRAGEAILFVSNRERRMLKAIERATRQPIEVMNLPTEQDINAARVERFKQRIEATLASEDLDFYRTLIADFQNATQAPTLEIAAALARLVQGEAAFLLDEKVRKTAPPHETEPRRPRDDGERVTSQGKQQKKRQSLGDQTPKPLKDHPDVPMQRFRLEVGYADGVKPGHVVGAIANEAELESQYIGHIEIYDDFTTVDLPADMPREVFEHLRKVRVCQRPLNLSRMNGAGPSGDRPQRKKPAKKTTKEPRRKPGKKPAGKGPTKKRRERS